MTTAAHVVLGTDRFDDDLAALTGEYGFRVDAIYPADSPTVAVVSGHGVALRLERVERPAPITVCLVSGADWPSVRLPGGSQIDVRRAGEPPAVPEAHPSLVVSHDSVEHGADRGTGRAGMRYRDLIPDRWGGRFIASHITIPNGGPVPDYVHFHRVRFQVIVVKSGWVRVVYEDQGEPFVMHPGDCVLQPPEIRHRVLESSPGLEVIEVSCPALHETIADWTSELPNGFGSSVREWSGQRFVRHVADGASYAAWRHAGWEARDSAIGGATGDLAGVRVARPVDGTSDASELSLDTELALLVVLRGAVTFDADDGGDAGAGRLVERLVESSSVAIPAGVRYRLSEPSSDCELLDVTLPA